ncbi:aldo/keto reductase [Actinoallomurus sp. CA-150999]|uniref:aldo/keto reductase n=1 Tax=Actinoallomurus sp. CA-150999 TaxID=3239887 RepID=UPI003D8C279E
MPPENPPEASAGETLYGWGANEELLVEALYPYPDEVLITTKVGVVPPEPPREAALCGRPEVLRDQVEQALRRLRVDRLDLLQLHRIDPEVPPADQVGTLGELQADGKIGHIGLSEVTAAELDQARQLVDVAGVIASAALRLSDDQRSRLNAARPRV